VLGALSNEEKKRLLDGVQLDDGLAQFGTIEAGGGEGANCWYRVTISEGRNREVRRMFEAVGHAVSRLIRIRYGAVVLPRGLKRGAFVELDERDIAALTSAVGRSESRADPRGPASGAGEDGEARQGRGPRRNDKPRGGRGRPDAGAGRPPEQQAASAEDDGEEHGPHEFQPPMPRKDAPRDANRRRGGKGRGPGAGNGNGGAAPRSGLPGNFGGNSAQGQRRRDDGGGRGDRADKGPGGAQPDPMKTSFGYIGAETFTRQRQAQGQRRGSGNGPAGGGGGGGTGPRRGAGGGAGGGGGGGGGNRGGGNRGNGGGNRGGNR
jgi:23S rRNA pseudouridine2605 synthase